MHCNLNLYTHKKCFFSLGTDEMVYLPFIPQVVNYSLITSGVDVSVPVYVGFSFPIGNTFFSTLYVGTIYCFYLYNNYRYNVVICNLLCVGWK